LFGADGAGHGETATRCQILQFIVRFRVVVDHTLPELFYGIVRSALDSQAAHFDFRHSSFGGRFEEFGVGAPHPL
jgi:hypothetical protein